MGHCSCGNNEDHVIARRRTADDKVILFWSDGGVTGMMGVDLYGRGPRDPGRKNDYLKAAWLLAGEVELYDRTEVKRAVKVARRAIQQLSLSPVEYFRRVMAGARFQFNGKVVRERG
jgi:hypothetical protein